MTRRRAAILGAIALAAVGFAIWALTRPEQVRVASVIGEDVSEARSLLEGRGLDVVTQELESCDDPQTVIEQQPVGGSEIDEGSPVTLTVSQGQTIKVPALRNRPLGEARDRLDRVELLVQTDEQASREVDPGNVITSDPLAGEDVECRSAVTLFVSKGPNLITLPDVIGAQQADAEAELENLGLIVNVDPRDDDEPEGTVIGEDPRPGSELLRGDRVTIIVSTGAGSVIVPSVAGQSEEAAIDVLQGRGLSVEVLDEETDDEGDDGRVLDQAPSSGTRVRQGDTVTIVVGEFVAPEEETTTTTTTEPETGAEAP